MKGKIFQRAYDMQPKEVREKLDKMFQKKDLLKNWGKANEPPDGWYFDGTKDNLKEIKLRRKYLKEKPKMLWLDYLGKNGLKVNRKVTVAEDGSEIEKSRIKKLESSPAKKLAKDSSEIKETIKLFSIADQIEESEDENPYNLEIYINEEYICKVKYSGESSEDLVSKFVDEKVWRAKGFHKIYGKLKDCSSEMSVM